MALFKKVEKTKGGIKVLAYGSTGSGKTTFALTFPKVVAVDTEDGMRWYLDNPNLKYRLTTTSADEVEEALEEVEEELIDEMETFVLDSETKVYENMQHSALNLAEKRARQKGQSVDDANISQREWGKIKLITKRIQASKITLASKGINIVSISQEKDIKEKKGDNFVVVGNAPDGAKGIEYDYDIVIRLFTEKDSKTGEETYKAEVFKDRTQTFKKGDVITNPSYDCWKSVVEGVANLKQDTIDFKRDIDKDEEKMKTELEELEDLSTQFKGIMKNLGATQKKEVATFAKDLGIDNPLKCDNVSLLQQLVDFANNL